MPDPTDTVVDAVRADILRRSEVGIAKYGVTLGDAELGHIGFLRHAYEEALDLANYLKGAILELEKTDG